MTPGSLAEEVDVRVPIRRWIYKPHSEFSSLRRLLHGTLSSVTWKVPCPCRLDRIRIVLKGGIRGQEQPVNAY